MNLKSGLAINHLTAWREKSADTLHLMTFLLISYLDFLFIPICRDDGMECFTLEVENIGNPGRQMIFVLFLGWMLGLVFIFCRCSIIPLHILTALN